MHVAFRLILRLIAGCLPVLLAGRVAAQAPVITLNPQSQTNNVNTVVTFNTEATGEAPLIYRYFFNETLLGAATNGLVTIPIISVLQAGNYLCVVSNALGQATSAPAVLTVIGPPAISSQPTNLAVFVGQTARFSVTAVSPTPPTYQWLFSGTSIQDATNSILLIPNTATNNAGPYQVRVTNPNGTVQSLFATLTVNPLPAPSLIFGPLTSTNRIRVPVLFTSHGSETNISFSASFDPQAYTNAGFEPDLAEAEPAAEVRPAALPPESVVTVDDSDLAVGRIGVAIAWETNHLPPGQSLIGNLVFDLVDELGNPFAGLLALTNTPTPAVFAPPIEGSTNIALNPMNPQLLETAIPTLNRQTGYLEQGVLFGNPGNTLFENARLTVANLGFDGLTNLMLLANAQGILLPSLLEYVDLGAVAPTELREAILQYYVSDRVTIPNPTFNLYGTPAVIIPPPQGNLLTNAVTRRTNDLVLVEFPTQKDFRYYIEYAPDLNSFTNGGFQTSLPPMLGTGSNRQWLDSGPPRTDSLPAGTNRFYRVIEVR